MKRILLGAAAAALAMTSVAASAQPYRGHENQGHYTQAQYRGHEGGARGYRGGGGHYRAGQVFPGYRDRGRMVSNWGRYHLPAPRPGYAYYYDDDGGIVMAAIASGLIGMALDNAYADPGYGYPGYAYPDDGYPPAPYYPY